MVMVQIEKVFLLCFPTQEKHGENTQDVDDLWLNYLIHTPILMEASLEIKCYICKQAGVY